MNAIILCFFSPVRIVFLLKYAAPPSERKREFVSKIQFLGKSAKPCRYRLQPNLMTVSVCGCFCVCMGGEVCVCVLPVCVNVCSQVAKILKNHLYGIGHFQWIRASPVFRLHNIELILNVKLLEFYLICEYLVFEVTKKNLAIIIANDVGPCYFVCATK